MALIAAFFCVTYLFHPEYYEWFLKVLSDQDCDFQTRSMHLCIPVFSCH